MARTPSNMLPLGTALPEAILPDVDGSAVHLAQQTGERGLLVMFICNHCPFVIHIAPALHNIIAGVRQQGFGVVAINANDPVAYPADAPDRMGDFLAQYQLDIPYLFDETQSVAKAFDAACTPDFYLFDAQHRLVYRGQLDDSRPGNDVPVSGADLLAAAAEVAAGKAPATDQKPSLGCNIKWRDS